MKPNHAIVILLALMATATQVLAEDAGQPLSSLPAITLAPADLEELGANLIMAARGCAAKPDAEVLACEQKVLVSAIKLQQAINKPNKGQAASAGGTN